MSRLCSLSFVTTPEYKENLQTLLGLIEEAPQDAIIVAPEVCLTGFDYANFDAVVAFAPEAIVALKKASASRVIILTMIERRATGSFNFVKVFHRGELLYERAKSRLFQIGNEHKYMQAGSDEDFALVEIDGIKIGLLICFELRFKELWKRVEGADVVAVCSWWGVSRTEHFNSFTKTLAIMNQCYVVASDSANDECTKMSSIISPKGAVAFNGNRACLEQEYKEREIAVVRRFIDVGMQKSG